MVGSESFILWQFCVVMYRLHLACDFSIKTYLYQDRLKANILRMTRADKIGRVYFFYQCFTDAVLSCLTLSLKTCDL